MRCTYCGKPAERNYHIHKAEGGLWGHQGVLGVSLCEECGSQPTPTVDDIWAKLAPQRGLDL